MKILRMIRNSTPDDNYDGFYLDDDNANDDPVDPFGAQHEWTEFDHFDANDFNSSRNSSTDSSDSDGHHSDHGLDGMNVYNFNDANDDNIGARLPSPPTMDENEVSVPIEITVEAHPPTVPHGQGCSTCTENIQPLEDITHDERSLQIHMKHYQWKQRLPLLSTHHRLILLELEPHFLISVKLGVTDKLERLDLQLHD